MKVQKYFMRTGMPGTPTGRTLLKLDLSSLSIDKDDRSNFSSGRAWCNSNTLCICLLQSNIFRGDSPNSAKYGYGTDRLKDLSAWSIYGCACVYHTAGYAGTWNLWITYVNTLFRSPMDVLIRGTNRSLIEKVLLGRRANRDDRTSTARLKFRQCQCKSFLFLLIVVSLHCSNDIGKT